MITSAHALDSGCHLGLYKLFHLNRRYDTQHNNIQDNDTQHNNKCHTHDHFILRVFMLSVIGAFMLCIICTECKCVECYNGTACFKNVNNYLNLLLLRDLLRDVLINI